MAILPRILNVTHSMSKYSADMKMKTFTKQQTGVTIIELMIALVIGSIIMVGVGTVYSSSKRSYKVQEEFARLQENGRFALNYIGRFVREAGYAGCASGLTNLVNDVDPPDSIGNGFNTGIEGYEAAGTAPGETLGSALVAYPNPTAASTESSWTATTANTAIYSSMVGGTDSVLPHSDVLIARGAEGSGVEIDVTNSSAQIFFTNTGTDPNGCGAGSPSYSGLCDDDILMISDCQKSVVFKATNVQLAGSVVNVSHSATGNTVSSWGGANPDENRAFGPGDEMLKVFTKTFYVGNGTNGPALFMKKGDDTGQELVEGVENMQVLYGEDTDATPDNVPDRYVPADQVTDFANVVAVRITLLIRSLNEIPHRTASAKTYVMGGSTAATGVTITAPTDKRMRRIMSMTIKLRNRAFSL